MPSLNLESFGDLVEASIIKYRRGDYVSLITDLVNHPAYDMLVKKSMADSVDISSYQYQWPVRIGTAGSFRFVAPTTPDLATMSDDFTHCRLPIRKMEVGYAFLEEMIDFNMGPEQVFDLVKAKEAGADFDFAEGFENAWWSFTSASNTLSFYGLPYYVTKNSTVGFNGGAPTGYTTVAGLSPTTYARWQNYSGNYTNVALDDLIDKMRTMAEATNFVPVLANEKQIVTANQNKLGYYMNQATKKVFENVADSRNDNLGTDVAKNDNKVTFRGTPITYVSWLDQDTTNPVYQLNWNTWRLLVRKKWWMKRKTLAPYPGQRNQVAVFKDTYCQPACFDRRRNGILATATTYPS